MLDVKTLAGFAGVISCTVAANLVLKLGAAAPPAERVFFGVLGWKSAAGGPCRQPGSRRADLAGAVGRDRLHFVWDRAGQPDRALVRVSQRRP